MSYWVLYLNDWLMFHLSILSLSLSLTLDSCIHTVSISIFRLKSLKFRNQNAIAFFRTSVSCESTKYQAWCIEAKSLDGCYINWEGVSGNPAISWGTFGKTIGKPYMIKIKTWFWFQINNHVKDEGSPASCFKSPSSRRPGYLLGPTTESTPRRASSPTTTVQQWDSGAQQSGFDRRFCRNNAISESHKLKTCFIKRCEVKCINHREYTFELSRWFWVEHTIMQSCFENQPN